MTSQSQLMDNLLQYLNSRIPLDQTDISLIENYFISAEFPAQFNLLNIGKTERFIYFLSSGIVKGYQYAKGKKIVEHLVDEQNFFNSIDSFIHQKPSKYTFETVTDGKLLKISKANLGLLRSHSNKWNIVVEAITNEHLNCKIQRSRDFQILSAKERYLKFMEETPNLALNVSIETIASYLGMEPQSLSRIRKQITF